jgi:hypothetical protein
MQTADYTRILIFHLGKIFPFNPRDQSMLSLMRHMALHLEGAQH